MTAEMLEQPSAGVGSEVNRRASSFGAALTDVAEKLATDHADDFPDPVFELGRMARREPMGPEAAVRAFRRVWDQKVRGTVRLGPCAADVLKAHATDLLLEGYFAAH